MKVQTFLIGLAIPVAALVAATLSAEGQPPELPKPHESLSGNAERAEPADDQPQAWAVDQMLEQALKGHGSLMFGGHVTSKTDSRADLVITSARSVKGAPQNVRVRSGTTTIFRADAGRDEFTKRGGWYWRCGETEGKTRFTSQDNSFFKLGSRAGLLIRVVYQLDGTVHWYPLHYDFRC